MMSEKELDEEPAHLQNVLKLIKGNLKLEKIGQSGGEVWTS